MSSGSGGGSGGKKNTHISKLVPDSMKNAVSRLKELFIGDDFSDELICSALHDSNMNLDDAATRLADLGSDKTEMLSTTGSTKMKELYLGSGKTEMVSMTGSTKMKEPYLVRGSLYEVPEIMVKKVATQLREAFGLIVSDEQICSTLKECNMSAEDAASKLVLFDLGGARSAKWSEMPEDMKREKKEEKKEMEKKKKQIKMVIEKADGNDIRKALEASNMDVDDALKKLRSAGGARSAKWSEMPEDLKREKKEEKKEMEKKKKQIKMVIEKADGNDIRKALEASNMDVDDALKKLRSAGGARSAKWSEMPEDMKREKKEEKKEMEKKKKQIKMVIEKADGNDIRKALEASNMDVDEALKKLRSAGFDEKAPQTGPPYPLYECPDHDFEANVYKRFKINCYQLVFMWLPEHRTLTFHGLWPAWRSTRIHEKTREETINVKSVKFAKNDNTEEGKRDRADKLAAKRGKFPNFESYSEDVVKKLRGELEQIWVGKENDGETFWLREWGGHGIFAGMKCETYFETSLRLAKTYFDGLQAAFKGERKDEEHIQVAKVENRLKSKLGHKPFLRIKNEGQKNKKKPVLQDIILLFDLDLKIMDHDGVRKFEECDLCP